MKTGLVTVSEISTMQKEGKHAMTESSQPYKWEVISQSKAQNEHEFEK
jgi:hypothetical protein